MAALEANTEKAAIMLSTSNVSFDISEMDEVNEAKVANGGVSAPPKSLLRRPSKPKGESILVTQRDFIEENKRNVLVLNKALHTLSEREASSSYIKAHVAHHVLHAVAPLIVEKEVLLETFLQKQSSQANSASNSRTTTPARRRPSVTSLVDNSNNNNTFDSAASVDMLASLMVPTSADDGPITSSSTAGTMSTENTPIRRQRSSSAVERREGTNDPPTVTRRRPSATLSVGDTSVAGSSIASSVRDPSFLSPSADSKQRKRTSQANLLMSPNRTRRSSSVDETEPKAFSATASVTPPTVKIKPKMNHILANKAGVRRTSEGVGIMKRLQREDSTAGGLHTQSVPSMNTVALAQIKRKIIHETLNEFLHSEHQSLGHLDEKSLNMYVKRASMGDLKSPMKLNLIQPTSNNNNTSSSGDFTPSPTDKQPVVPANTPNNITLSSYLQSPNPAKKRLGSTRKLSANSTSSNTIASQKNAAVAPSTRKGTRKSTAKQSAVADEDLPSSLSLSAPRRFASSLNDYDTASDNNNEPRSKSHRREISLDDFLTSDVGDVHITQVEEDYEDEDEVDDEEEGDEESALQYLEEGEHDPDEEYEEGEYDYEEGDEEDGDEDDRAFSLGDVPLTPTRDRMKSFDSDFHNHGSHPLRRDSGGEQHVHPSAYRNSPAQKGSFAKWTANEDGTDTPHQMSPPFLQQDNTMSNNNSGNNRAPSHLQLAPPKPTTSQIPVRKAGRKASAQAIPTAPATASGADEAAGATTTKK